jgi:hypothetical protein
MNSTIIPAVPTLVLVLVNFFAPYLISLATAAFWPKAAKKWVSIGISVLLTAVVILVAHFGFAFVIPAWPQLLILGVLVSQTAYSVLLKDTADVVAAVSGVGSKSMVVTTTNPVTTIVTGSDAGTPIVSTTP